MRIAVYGIGNVLAHDDAVGPSVVRMLDAEWHLPANVVIEDLGTPAIELPSHLSGFDTIILVDAVAAAAPPGSIRLYGRNEILACAPGLRISPHDPALRETLLMLDLTGDGPREIRLVGVVAELTDMGIGLSDAVARALPAACDAVVAELVKIGVVATRRAVPRNADLWWAA